MTKIMAKHSLTLYAGYRYRISGLRPMRRTAGSKSGFIDIFNYVFLAKQ